MAYKQIVTAVPPNARTVILTAPNNKAVRIYSVLVAGPVPDGSRARISFSKAAALNTDLDVVESEMGRTRDNLLPCDLCLAANDTLQVLLAGTEANVSLVVSYDQN